MPITLEKFPACLIHVVDSHHGIYSYQIFAERFKDNFNVSIGEEKQFNECIEDILKGPDNEHYCDSWNDVSNLMGLTLTVDFGHGPGEYTIFENEGIFLLPVGVNISENAMW